MPYRDGGETYSPDMHVAAEDGSFVRKSAVRNDERHQVEAVKINSNRSYLKDILHDPVKWEDLVHGEAIAEYVAGLRCESLFQDNLVPNRDIITGNFLGSRIDVYKTGSGSYIDEEPVSPETARKFYDALYPLIMQRDKDRKNNK